VPDWLVDRLVHTAGATREEVMAMSPEEAMQAWEAFITRPPR
jgi:mRNA interferase RelE/StbE